MSSAPNRRGPATASSASTHTITRPTASIARSISWGFTWRKFFHFLCEDLLALHGRAAPRRD